MADSGVNRIPQLRERGSDWWREEGGEVRALCLRLEFFVCIFSSFDDYGRRGFLAGKLGEGPLK